MEAVVCAACAAESPGDSRFCRSCGQPFDAVSALPTAVGAVIAGPHVRRLISSDTIPAGGFAPGTILLKRYRVIGLLGRGGMGEVYRADDLKLGQAVALKFLPSALADDPVRRERFLAEVRITRQVSHPNICRVYDIAEVEDDARNGIRQIRYFLTMEYIDGEDLASLIDRIGYLSNAKALDLTRQLVMGLAAAHERGVLHRDLKPANVMVDGRGRVRITDFGLAIAAGDAAAQTELAGTPAYMAPEQLAGQGATVRSDIYALGLVLYELYTGKRAFRAASLAELRAAKETDVPSAPSDLRSDVDPITERVIMRCLERDPGLRPASVAQLAASLPGGDPLAALVAGGETPSPAMVAAAGSKEGLQPWPAVLLLGFIVIGLFAVALTNPYALAIFPAKAPAVLLERAHEIVREAGYTEAPTDSAYGFFLNPDVLNYLSRDDPQTGHWRRTEAFNPVRFWYRQSPKPLERSGAKFVASLVDVQFDDPKLNLPGEIRLTLDSDGHLRVFEAVPSSVLSPPDAPVRRPDWDFVKRVGPFDANGFESIVPKWTSVQPFDAQVAWRVVNPAAPDVDTRVEASAFEGRLVTAQVIEPWSRPLHDVPTSLVPPSVVAFSTILVLLLLGGGFGFARWNVRLGRGDRAGAIRLWGVAFVLWMGGWAVREHHVLSVAEFALFFEALAIAILFGGGTAVLYLALEPFVRRRWPHVLVTWARVWSSDWRDSRVARDVLVGIAAGIAVRLLMPVEAMAPEWVEHRSAVRTVVDMANLIDLRAFMAKTATDLLVAGLIMPLAILFMFFVMRMWLRRDFLAIAVTTLVFVTPAFSRSWSVGAVQFLEILIGLIVLSRVGLIGCVTALLVIQLTVDFPLVLAADTWWAIYGYVVAAVIVATAFVAFKISLSGRRLFELSRV